MARAAKFEGLPPQAKLLLYELANCYNHFSGFCNPSFNYLGCRSGLSKKQVGRWMRWLENKELIIVEDGTTHVGRSKRYALPFLQVDGDETEDDESGGHVRPPLTPVNRKTNGGHPGANGGHPGANGGRVRPERWTPVSPQPVLNQKEPVIKNQCPAKQNITHDSKPIDWGKESEAEDPIDPEYLKAALDPTENSFCGDFSSSKPSNETPKPKRKGKPSVSSAYSRESLDELPDEFLKAAFKKFPQTCASIRSRDIAGALTDRDQSAIDQINVDAEALKAELVRRGVNPKSLLAIKSPK